MPELVDLINKKDNKKKQKIQLSMRVNFMCITDKEKTRTFYVNSDNEEIRSSDDTNNINKIFESFLSNYQKEEQILRNSSNYTFESIDMLGIHFHDIKLKRDSSYIKSPDWILNKSYNKPPQNTKDNKCFEYSTTVALNHREIGKNPQKISKIKPYINNYNWKDINFPAGIYDWKTFERNNKDIALNILSAFPDEETINIIYKSKYNCKRKNQVVLLMITDINNGITLL